MISNSRVITEWINIGFLLVKGFEWPGKWIVYWTEISENVSVYGLSKDFKSFFFVSLLENINVLLIFPSPHVYNFY